MEGIFTLPYSEYSAIVQLQKVLRKNDGYSVFIPVSRQQKGIDFVVLNCENRAALRIQVKSSRAYLSSDSERIEQGKKFTYNLWFSNFIGKFESGRADWYFLFGMYPIYTTKHNIKTKTKCWNSIILAFTESEMKHLLAKVRLKKGGEKDRFFDVGFNSPKAVFGTRGFSKKIDLTGHLLVSRKADLTRALKRRD